MRTIAQYTSDEVDLPAFSYIHLKSGEGSVGFGDFAINLFVDVGETGNLHVLIIHLQYPEVPSYLGQATASLTSIHCMLTVRLQIVKNCSIS